MSVVIPFYNREKCLSRAIESVISQTWTDWEIMLVDDGSTDNSIGIALAYVQRYPDRIRLLRQENSGPGVARNTGIAAAAGAFIAILDSDDEWNSNFIARIMAAYRECAEVDWIYVNARRVSEDGKVVVPSVFDDSRSAAFRRLRTRRCGHLNVIDDPAFLETAIAATVKEGANSIIRRKVFDRVSYPNLRLGEDRVLTISGIAAGFQFGYIDEVLMTKYHHGDNTSLINKTQIDRILAGQSELIRSLIYVRDHLPLNRREKAALRLRLSQHYHEYAATLLATRRGYVRPIPYMIKSIMAEPRRSPTIRAIGRKLKSHLG